MVQVMELSRKIVLARRKDGAIINFMHADRQLIPGVISSQASKSWILAVTYASTNGSEKGTYGIPLTKCNSFRYLSC